MRSSRSPAPAGAESPPCCTAWPVSCARTPERCCGGASGSTPGPRLVVRPCGAASSASSSSSDTSSAELTAAENVALPLLLAGVRRRAARTAALTWLDRLGVAEVADERPGQMSGGQQQRVALARALVTEPRALFADEPTGALDSLTGEAVLGHLVRVAREQQTTVILVTHDATVAAYADREVVLRDGAVDRTGLGLSPVTDSSAGDR